jgi:hypothetical protein
MRKDTKNTIGWDNPMPGELKTRLNAHGRRGWLLSSCTSCYGVLMTGKLE